MRNRPFRFPINSYNLRRRNILRPGAEVKAVLAALAGLAATPAAAQTVFFPDVPAFELPLASPRVYGLAGRVLQQTRGDNRFGAETEGEAVLGESFPIFALRSGDRPISLQFGTQVYGRFSLDDSKTAHISSDWQVGFDLHADLRPWEVNLQIYHESSHLGDEYASRFGTSRLDWTRQVLALWAGRRMGGVRVLGAVSYVPIDELDLERWGAAFGVDYRGGEFVALGQRMRTVAGVFTEGAAATSWRLSTTAKLGVAFPGMAAGREFSLSLLAHDGLSTQRQFYRKESRYYGVEIGFQL